MTWERSQSGGNDKRPAVQTTTFLFVGGYTNTSDVGIRVFDASDPTSDLVEIGSNDSIEHPSYLAVHPTEDLVYAVSEVDWFDGRPGGGLVALRFDSTRGSITPIDQVSSHGDAPCHISVSPDGWSIHVANYASGSVAAYRLREDGQFGELIGVHQHEGNGPTERQDGPHAHCVRPSPDGRWLYTADLGTDEVSQYRINLDGLTPINTLPLRAGAGPRQIVVQPDMALAFIINELDNTLTACEIANDGALVPKQTITTLPDRAASSIAADVQIHPSGAHIYASNRGDDSIAVFALADTSTPLESLGTIPAGGETPRSMVVHPSGQALLVANQGSDSIVRLPLRNGRPEAGTIATRTPEPTCLAISESSI